MGFEFKNRKTTVEVCGKTYEIEQGNVEFVQNVAKVQARLAAMTESAITKNPNALVEVSDTMRDLVGSILGAEAQTEIFSDRTRNLIDEIDLLTYLLTAVQGQQNDTVDEILSRLNVVQQPAKPVPIKPAIKPAKKPAKKR